jgi:hypothetical protein
MKKIASIIPLFAALVLSGCDTTLAPPSAMPQSPEASLAECLDLGFAPDTVEMEQCLATDSRAGRLVLIDQATYGTL